MTTIGKHCVGVLLAALAFAPIAKANESVTVAVAANFLATADDLVTLFSDTNDVNVRVIPGSSGKHASMVLNGGPVDVFLSADKARPDALSERGLVARRAVYALGRLSLYVPGSGDPQTARDFLMSGGVQRLAVADPRLAPYGVAAFDVLDTWGLGENQGKKLVIGDNIGQTFGFVATGNADAGFVAYSQILTLPAEQQTSSALIEAEDHAPIEQHIVLTKRGADNPAAVAFYTLVLGPEGRDVIASHGYQVPEL